jgi:hypothetical protein
VLGKILRVEGEFSNETPIWGWHPCTTEYTGVEINRRFKIKVIEIIKCNIFYCKTDIHPTLYLQ